MRKRHIRLAALAVCILLFTALTPAEALACAADGAKGAVLSAANNGAPVITSQPRDASVKQGATVTFRVKAGGKSLKYQWYYRKNPKSSWTKLAGETGAVLTFTTGRKNGYQYRCRVYNSSGKVYSKTVTLKVNYVKYRALLIGEVYFPDWEYATRNRGDVLRMKSMLGAIKPPKGGSYAVTCKYDLSNTGIKNAISTAFKDADSNDVSLFFIATHGVTDVETSCRAGALCTVNSLGEVTLLNLGTLARWLKEVPGKVIVMIGSCGSGAAVSPNGRKGLPAAGNTADDEAFAEAVIQAFAANDPFLPETKGGTVSNIGEFCQSKFYVLTAAMHMESSWGQQGADQSESYNYFTYYLTKGAKGSADENGDGQVTLNELYQYVYANTEDMGSFYEYGEIVYISQHARVYPENSGYVLFKTS